MIIIFVKEDLNVKLDFIDGVIIGLLSGQLILSWNYFFVKKHTNPRIVPYSQKQEFQAGILHNNGNYIQGSVNISFKFEYMGKLKNGYFVSEIVFPKNDGNNIFGSVNLRKNL